MVVQLFRIALCSQNKVIFTLQKKYVKHVVMGMASLAVILLNYFNCSLKASFTTTKNALWKRMLILMVISTQVLLNVSNVIIARYSCTWKLVEILDHPIKRVEQSECVHFYWPNGNMIPTHWAQTSIAYSMLVQRNFVEITWKQRWFNQCVPCG